MLYHLFLDCLVSMDQDKFPIEELYDEELGLFAFILTFSNVSAITRLPELSGGDKTKCP